MGKGDEGAFVDAAGEVPRPSARPPELVEEEVPLHRGHVSHGMEAEAAHGGLHVRGDGQEVDEVGRKEGGRVRWDPGRARPLGRSGCDEGRELGVGRANPRGKVSGNGLQQGGDNPVLAAVEGFEAVQARVGLPQLRSFHAVADSL